MKKIEPLEFCSQKPLHETRVAVNLRPILPNYWVKIFLSTVKHCTCKSRGGSLVSLLVYILAFNKNNNFWFWFCFRLSGKEVGLWTTLILKGANFLLSQKMRDGMGREVVGGFRMGNTCKSMADSCQCMAKTTTIL